MSEPSGREQWVERAAFLLSLCVVVGMVVAIVWFDAPFTRERALVAARIVATERHADRVVVRFELENRGGQAATEVLVRVTTASGEPQVDQTIAHLPAGSTRRGTAVLYGKLVRPPVARVLGYQEP